MRFRILADVHMLCTGAALLAIGACSENAQISNASLNAGVSAGNQVAALPEGQRNAVFIRAIRDAGQDCQHVESSQPAGRYRGMPVWRATCSGEGHWTLVIADDGTAQILNADQARLVTDEPQDAANRTAD